MHPDPAPLRLTTTDGIAELVLSAPERRQAIDPPWIHAFLDAVVELEHRTDARAVLIRAEGSIFTVGGDLDHFTEHAERLGDELDAMVGPFHEALTRLGELPLPVVCAVQGAAAGGGLGLLWCADEVLLAPEARIACGFARIGLSGDGGSSWALPRLVGLRRAQQLTMGGRVLTAEEAVAWGLATEVVEADRLEARARERAAHYAAGPTVAYGHMRRLLRASTSSTWAEQLRAEHAAMAATGATADGREGVASFVERRVPHFLGT